MLSEWAERHPCDCGSKPEDTAEAIRRQRNCDNEYRPVEIRIGEGQDRTTVDQCPWSWVRNETPEFWPLFTRWQQCRQYHCLPYSGGLFEQPNRIMDAFTVFDQCEGERVARELKEERKETEKMRRRRGNAAE